MSGFPGVFQRQQAGLRLVPLLLAEHLQARFAQQRGRHALAGLALSLKRPSYT